MYVVRSVFPEEVTEGEAAMQVRVHRIQKRGLVLCSTLGIIGNDLSLGRLVSLGHVRTASSPTCKFYNAGATHLKLRKQDMVAFFSGGKGVRRPFPSFSRFFSLFRTKICPQSGLFSQGDMYTRPVQE
jgi:hypothetical protein